MTSHLPRLGAAALALMIALGAHAQAPDQPQGLDQFARMSAANPPRPIAAPELERIALSGTGSRASEVWETQFGTTTVRNVTQPAIYPVLPAKGKANGAALVIAPGGAFMGLSFDSEGMMVARYLAERGVTCFVLTYRLDPTPKDGRQFLDVLFTRMRAAKPKMTTGDLIDSPAQAQAQEDGLASIRYVRSHAAQYGIDPKRIGMIGFSAGGMTTMNVATAYDAASRPDYIGVIYGAMAARPVPKDAPPAFIALAANDSLLGYASVPIFDAWRAAGKQVELHIYAQGDHGFGMRKTGTSADHWIENFTQWMQASKLIP